MGFLNGKRILITGIASNRSIAYGIAKIMHRENAELAFTFKNKKLKSRLEKFANNFDSDIIIECDVSNDNSINHLFDSLSKKWTKFDGFVHSVAYAPTDQLNGDYINKINRKDFSITHDISSYSFVALAKSSKEMLNNNSSLITLTYVGSEKVVPNYNIMGIAKASLESNTRYMAYYMGKYNIRVNAISAGPIRTLASSSIKNFKRMLDYHKSLSPIKRAITIEDIGNVAAFLCSDLSIGITGEIIHVDGGFNISIYG